MKIKKTPKDAAEYTAAYRRKRKWRTVVTCLAAVVIFCTTYALILPAVTLENSEKQNGSYQQPEENRHDGVGITASETDDGIAVVDENGTFANKEEALADLAETYGIYPGTKDDAGVWTAYDAAGEADANIKAVVTLPAGSAQQDGYYLYIRAVKEGESYYPNSETLNTVTGETNDMQCYAIHWVRVYEEATGQWKYEVQTTSVLDESSYATVQITYLKDSAYLKGHKANRKLQVYNSRVAGGTDLESAHSTPTDVTANEDAYTGFTFQTNRGGPYVFVSKYLYEGYVANLTVDKITDGTGMFDEKEGAGNDTGADNKIIRSYDSISYDLTANFGARSSTSTDTSATLWFEATLDADITKAAFNTASLNWMDLGYTIEYLDESNNVVLTQKTDGKYYDASGTEKSLNDLASDSSQETSSYTTSIVSQRLRGAMTKTAAQNLLSGNQTVNVVVQVLGAKNEDVIRPAFRAWFDGNEDNYGSESGNGDDVHLAEIVKENKETAGEVTVSAAARFNLELDKAENVNCRGWFDLSKGNEVSKLPYKIGNQTITGEQLYGLLERLANLPENRDKSEPEAFTDTENTCADLLQGLPLADYSEAFQNIRYGRITGYGIGLQVYNNVSSAEGTASKGFKGISLPQGDIDFDLALSTTVSQMGASEDDSRENTNYYATLWEYNENVNAPSGKQGKNMYWSSLPSTKYAAWAAPYNSGNTASACYNGGIWTKGEGDHFTVSGYDFNFLSYSLSFPTHKAGNSGATNGYNTYIGNFSAGYVQVLNVFPRNQSETLNVYTQVTVRNLEVTTTDGTAISPDVGDLTGYAHEAVVKDKDKDGNLVTKNDNQVTDNIPLYAKGGMTKANAFCTAALWSEKTADFSSKTYFLGTDFWSSGYDCSAFAGQEITVVGAARINAGDYHIRHMNMLQLFDSKALSLVEEKTPVAVSRVTDAKEGKTTILYAADPDYPGGYDTGVEKVMEYMSSVREEDLIYYTSLAGLKNAGYTCVGVMAELRNWDISGEGGYSTVLKIPMKVSEDGAVVNTVVGTVNTVRIWTNEADMENGKVSWADGVYDPSKGKNSVKGYTPVDTRSNEHYSGEVKNNEPYTKTGYEEGNLVVGNHGGYVYGSSLLILGYKSEVDIGVDNGRDGGLIYNLDKGDYMVNYHLKNIIARVDQDAGNAQSAQTDLTVLAKVDTARPSDVDPRIAVAADSYSMKPASDKMVLVDENGIPLAEQSVKIGADPASPTTVRYAFKKEDGTPDTTKIYEIQIYAEADPAGSQVRFEIKNATVNVSLPDITYDAVIDPQVAKHNDTIEAAAYIKGTSDVRAYSDTAGNMDKISISIVQLKSTRLVKAVDKRYIELDGTFTYTVTYTNSGQENVSLYLYDLLPNREDIRGSDFAENSSAILRKISASLSGGDGSFTADIQFYYSKQEYWTLYNTVKLFGGDADGTGKNTSKIEELLTNEEWFQPLGTISSANDHQFQISSRLSGMTNDQLTQEMSEITGIYAVVKNLSGGRSLSIQMKIETEDNETGDLYRNIANSWLGDSSDPLTSNRVETSVLSRAISGVVWHDANLNGTRDAGEETISGVTCTLFKWDENKNQYVICTQDVTGTGIIPFTTGTNGAYSFEKLSAGKYIVAFSGDALEKYTGATTYRVNGVNDTATNDAAALTGTKSTMDTEVSELAGIDEKAYSYVIAYDLTGDAAKKQAEAATLHTIDDILMENNITLTNDVELYANLDCGLIIADFELPQTGGSGTTPYTAGGLLTIGAGLLLWYRNKKRKKEGDPSL